MKSGEGCRWPSSSPNIRASLDGARANIRGFFCTIPAKMAFAGAPLDASPLFARGYNFFHFFLVFLGF